jgi:hypothetical protein
MANEAETVPAAEKPSRPPENARLAAQLEAERFYSVIPPHVWDGLRHGDELGRDIAAAAGLVRWRRQALRRAVAALRRFRSSGAKTGASQVFAQRFGAAIADARRLYRAAQAEHRQLLDERWRRRLAALRAGNE